MTYPHDATVTEPADTSLALSGGAAPAVGGVSSLGSPQAGSVVGDFARIASPLSPTSPYRDAVGEIIRIVGHHEESTTKHYGPLVWVRFRDGTSLPRFLCELKPVRDAATIERERYRPGPWKTYWSDLDAAQAKFRPQKPRPTYGVGLR